MKYGLFLNDIYASFIYLPKYPYMKMRPLNYTPWYDNPRTLLLLIILMPVVGFIGLVKTTLIPGRKKLLMIPAYFAVIIALILFFSFISSI